MGNTTSGHDVNRVPARTEELIAWLRARAPMPGSLTNHELATEESRLEYAFSMGQFSLVQKLEWSLQRQQAEQHGLSYGKTQHTIDPKATATAGTTN